MPHPATAGRHEPGAAGIPEAAAVGLCATGAEDGAVPNGLPSGDVAAGIGAGPAKSIVPLVATGWPGGVGIGEESLLPDPRAGFGAPSSGPKPADEDGVAAVNAPSAVPAVGTVGIACPTIVVVGVSFA